MNILSFDFEEEIQKQEGERQRLLESQGVGRNDGSGGGGESQAKHSIVCRHWLRGMCIKGDFCDFTHQYNAEKMPLCRQYNRHGHCAEHERSACPLKHEPLNGGESGQPCVHYFLGFCRAGPRCKKKHVRRQVTDCPELLPDWYLQLLVSNREIIQPADRETEEKINQLEQICRELSRAPPHDGAASDGGPQGGRGGERERSGGTGRANADGAGDGDESADEVTRWGGGGLFSSQEGGELLGESDTDDPTDFGISIPSPTPVEGRVRCFVIKSMRMENIYTSVQLAIWATGRINTRTFDEAYRENDHVLLFFSANESGGFQGVGRMASPPDPTLHRGVWGGISARLGWNFRVHWLKQCTVEFEEFGNLANPLNDNHVIKKSRDGQELPLWVARKICRKLSHAPDEDLLSGTPLESEPRIDHSTFFTQLEHQQHQHQPTTQYHQHHQQQPPATHYQQQQPPTTHYQQQQPTTLHQQQQPSTHYQQQPTTHYQQQHFSPHSQHQQHHQPSTHYQQHHQPPTHYQEHHQPTTHCQQQSTELSTTLPSTSQIILSPAPASASIPPHLHHHQHLHAPPPPVSSFPPPTEPHNPPSSVSPSWFAANSASLPPAPNTSSRHSYPSHYGGNVI